MSTLGTNHPTLTDIQKTLDPDGKPARMIQMLTQSNPILKDMPWMPTNMTTTHQTSIVTSLPLASERAFNEGTVPTKETAAQSIEGTCMVENWSEVDKALADLSTDVGAYRLNKAQAFIEGLNQKMAQLTFYGNASLNPKQINGLATRMNSTTATNGQNVILGGGSGSDNTSIFLVGWGMNKVMGIYPKNSSAGLAHEDKGVVTRETAGGVTGALMDVYRDKWNWDFGLCFEDWRYAVRIANIDVSAQRTQTGAADLADYMIQAEGSIPFPEGARLVWYMSRALFTHFTRQRRSQVSDGGGLTFENVDGKRIPFFNSIPIRVCDAISLAEALVA